MTGAAGTPATRRRGRPAEADRRQQILLATQQLVHEQGWSTTSLRDIAARAGIAPGLLSYYFATKDDLLQAALADVDERVTRRWTTAMAGIDDPVERVRAGFQAAVGAFIEDPAMFHLFFDLLAAGRSNPQLQAAIREVVDNTVNLMAAEIEQVTDRLGIPLPNSSEVDLAGAVAAAFDGVLLHAAVRDVDPRPAFRALEQMVVSLVVDMQHSHGL